MPTRRLVLAALFAAVATAAPAQGKKGASDLAPALNIAGSYHSFGRNPDGSSYEGVVQIAQDGSIVGFTWRIGNDSYSGEGLIDGRIVAVDWGAASPVVYVVMPDGELHGTWDDGLGLEKLTPN